MMLIPLSADNNITSINLLVKKYNISELPTILIDEKVKITDVNDSSIIEKYLI
jgi:predicted transcriptional regulator